MAWTIHWLRAGGETGPWQSIVAAEIDAARIAFESKLPAIALDILVQRLPNAVIPELGMAGFALRSDLFSITIDPDTPTFEKALNDRCLRRVVAHEAHHCVRMRGPGYGHTLGEALVTEGLAGQFTLALFGGDPAPWECAISEETIRLHLPSPEELASRSYNHASWFFGQGGEHPRWLGYSLGFRLVGDSLATEPDLSGLRWAHVAAEDILGSHASVLQRA